MNSSEDVKLFCNGYYAEILIMDPFSLEIIFTLSSREKSDWISALFVLRPAKRRGKMMSSLVYCDILVFSFIDRLLLLQRMLFWV